MAKRRKTARPGGRGLMAIAAFKFVNVAFLLALTFGAVNLFHKDVEKHAENWVDSLRIDPDNRFIAAVLDKLNLVHTRELKQLTFLTLFYAALFATEGVGLALRQRWAEFLTVIATGLLVPVEVYEIFHAPSALKVLLLLVNLAVLAYLLFVIRAKK